MSQTLGPHDACPDCGQTRGYFHDLPGKCRPAAPPAPVATVTPLRATPPREGVHPYAAAAVTAELQRLDDLPRPWSKNSYWDQTTFDVACNLLELANSPWSGYTHADAERDLYAHAPEDGHWGRRDHERKWESARERIGTQGRPEPAQGETYAPPTVSVLDLDDPETDPLARFNLIDWHQLKHDEDKGEDWIIEPLISAGRMVALYSAPKAGKSLLILELAAAAALGKPTLGMPAREPVTVLYVDFENDPRGDIKPRLEDMGHDLDDLTGHLYVATFPSIAKLDTPQGGMDVLWLAREVGAQLVIIDTVSRTVGGEENDNNTWLAFYRNTGIPLKRDGIACVRLDHSGKDAEKGMRGGSAKYGDVDAVWRLTAESETVLNLVCTDHRMPIDEPNLTLVRRSDPVLWHEVMTDRTVAFDARDHAIDAAIDALGLPDHTSGNEIFKRLKAAGNGFNRNAVMRVVKARKLRLSGGTGTTPVPPGTTRREVVPEPPPRRGGSVPPPATGTRVPEPPSDDDQMPPMFVVGCKSCYETTTRDRALAHSGLCPKCARTAGLTTPEGDPA